MHWQLFGLVLQRGCTGEIAHFGRLADIYCAFTMCVHTDLLIRSVFPFAGDTIRIFRRSRSGRPTSAGTSSATSATSESQDSNDKLLRTEDLPAPDTGAGAREASSK